MSQCCSSCVMDTSDPDIVFDQAGTCNHCRSYSQRSAKQEPLPATQILENIRSADPRAKYHCMAAISGGIDSSYMLHLLRQAGLNPLVVHIDFGWSTEEAEQNLQNIVAACGFRLYRYKVDAAQFRELQLAYLRAGVIDLEIPTDHILAAALYKIAAAHNIRQIITGQNSATEYFMPRAWVFDKHDARNMNHIYNRFGSGLPINRLPTLGLFQKFYYYNIRKVSFLFLLEHLHYDKAAAERLLRSEYAWRPYEMKHGEATWTRFYQCYILPTRFGVDKRRAHLSNLVASGNMTRTQALELLAGPVYPYPFEEDKRIVLEKLGISESELNTFMGLPKRSHSEFHTEKQAKAFYRKLRSLLSPGLLKVSTSY